MAKDVFIIVRVSKEFKERFKDRAKRLKCTISDLARSVLEDHA